MHDMQQIKEIELPHKNDGAGETRAVPGIPFPFHMTSTEQGLGPASRPYSPSGVLQDGALPAWLPCAQGNQHFLLVNVPWELLPTRILLVPGL